jgi:hypothetical protein
MYDRDALKWDFWVQPNSTAGVTIGTAGDRECLEGQPKTSAPRVHAKNDYGDTG